MGKHVGLQEFVNKNPWFPSLVAGMLSNQLRDPKLIRTELDNLSKKEALMIGQSFSVALKARKVAEVGLDVWLHEYAALVQLSRENRFFVPMAVTIGQRKLEQALWGLAWKVGLGAVLSVLDVGTDANAIHMFLKEEKNGLANACIAIFSINMALQLGIVYANGKKRGATLLAREGLYVLSGIKPAVDAYRVVSGAKGDADSLLNPMVELTISKIVEM